MVASYVLEAWWETDGHSAELRARCREWIAAGNEDSSFLTQRLIAKHGDDKEDLAFALGWLRTRWTHPGWFFVWDASRRRWPSGSRQQLEVGWDNLALEWIRDARPENPNWARVWQALRRGLPEGGSEQAECLERGHAWLRWVVEEDAAQHEGWAYVWGLLLAAAEEDARGPLLELGRAFLVVAPNLHAGWPTVWGGLWQATRNDGDLERGYTWLRWVVEEDAAQHEGWAYVWGLLLAAAEEDARGPLLELGRAFLVVAPNLHAGWPTVWGGLWQAAPNEGDLEVRGHTWLRSVVEGDAAQHEGWAYVWGLLHSAAEGDARDSLLELGKAFLAVAPVLHSGWSIVWRGLWQATPNGRDLEARGHAWLRLLVEEHEAQHEGWTYVWRPLLAAADEDARGSLLTLGRAFLTVAPDLHSGWPTVWSELFEEDPGESDVQGKGRKWLRSVVEQHHGRHEGWTLVWEKLWDQLRDDELLALARAWLATGPQTDSESFVRQKIAPFETRLELSQEL